MNALKKGWLLAAVAGWTMGTPAFAAEEGPLTPKDQIAIAESIGPSMVRVEITFQFDKGEAPDTREGGGRYGYGGGSNAGELIKQERPLEQAGYLVATDKVATSEIFTHPRFIKSIAVRFGDEVVEAEPAGFAKEHNSVILKLKAPLKGAKPLAFAGATPGPHLMVTYREDDGIWKTSVWPPYAVLSHTERGKRILSVSQAGVLVDRKGTPVGLIFDDEVAADDSWKGSPLDWPLYSAEEMKAQLDMVEKAGNGGLLRVKLIFRSPKSKTGERGYFPGNDGSATEMNLTGILTSPDTILILATLKPNITARLEKILVHPVEGEAVAAKFSNTLLDYGAIVAKLEKPFPSPVKLSAKEIRDFRDVLVFSSEITIQGEKRVVYHGHERIGSFSQGWRRMILPRLSAGGVNTFVFEADGSLLVLPIARREKVAAEERWSSGGDLLHLAAPDLTLVLKDLAKNGDPHNVPLTEEEENRLAWIGVVLQPLDQELARENGVSDLTNDGTTGGMISYIYPKSPAEKLGLVAGDILLRLHVEGQPKPLEVAVDEGYGGQFPWDRMDQIPEQYFDRIPMPWAPAEDTVTRALTDIGFGKKATVEYFHDGKLDKKEFEIAQGPAHYDTAARHKSEALGITVRDLTFETRRYFQKKDEDPGVVISKIEQGSKASVSGLKPYEIVTHVNDEKVANVKDFERLIAGQKELRLQVLRMTKGRVAKIKMGEADGKAKPKDGEKTKPENGEEAPPKDGEKSGEGEGAGGKGKEPEGKAPEEHPVPME